MATTTTSFSGEPQPFGGLSNKRTLAKACPAEFKENNPWSNYASRVFFKGTDIANWKWKSNDEAERQRQKACFQALLDTFDLGHNEKESVAGWMLSLMLTEVPEYVPAKKG